MTNKSIATASALALDRNAIAAVRPVGISSGVGSLATLLAFTLLAVLVALLQFDADRISTAGISGLFVPDAVSLKATTISYWQQAERPFEAWKTLLGVVVLYYPGTILGTCGVAAINISLLWISSRFFCSIAYHICQDRPSAERTTLLISLALSSNIYVMEAMLFPNKEAPLILITCAFCYFLVVRKNIAVATVIAASAYIFRDGYSFILLICTAIIGAWHYLGRTVATVLVVGLFLALMFIPMRDVSFVDSAVARNIYLGEYLAGPAAIDLSTPLLYLRRLIGNIFNLGLRPQFADTAGGLYLLGVGFWQFGVILLGGVLWSLMAVAGRNEKLAMIAAVAVIGVIGVSFGSYVQPRYLIPLFYLLGLGLVWKRWPLWFSLGTCVLGYAVFYALNQLPPLSSGVTAVDWEW